MLLNVSLLNNTMELRWMPETQKQRVWFINHNVKEGVIIQLTSLSHLRTCWVTSEFVHLWACRRIVATHRSGHGATVCYNQEKKKCDTCALAGSHPVAPASSPPLDGWMDGWMNWYCNITHGQHTFPRFYRCSWDQNGERGWIWPDPWIHQSWNNILMTTEHSRVWKMVSVFIYPEPLIETSGTSSAQCLLQDCESREWVNMELINFHGAKGSCNSVW